MNIFSLITEVLGIGRTALTNRVKHKQLIAEQKHEITKALTLSKVETINNNTIADNDIDLQTVKDMNTTKKDEVVVYLFLIPFAVVNLVPFLVAFKNSDFENLIVYIKQSYETLDLLPAWYKYGLFAVMVSVLGLRSFAREFYQTIKRKIK